MPLTIIIVMPPDNLIVAIDPFQNTSRPILVFIRPAKTHERIRLNDTKFMPTINGKPQELDNNKPTA
jgi:hypothetical protein